MVGTGGKTGVAGQGGGAVGGQGGAMAQPRFSGHITTTASYRATGTTMKLAAQSLTTELGRSCGVTTCVSGGISP